MLKKILIGLLIFVVLLFGALAILPIVFKDKLTAIAKKEINDQVNAKVDWRDLGVTFFKDFPSISLVLKDVSVVNVAPFKGDTLAHIGEIAVSVNVMSLIKGDQIAVNGIGVDEPTINVKVLKDGTANYNIMKPDSSKKPASTEGGTFNVKLKKFSITKAQIVYDDQESAMYAKLENLNNNLSGDFTQSVFDVNTDGSVGSATVISGAVPYLNKVKISLKVVMNIDQANSKYTFKDNEIALNDLKLAFNGFVAMGKQKDMNMDVNFKASKTEFKNIISLIPAIYSDQFKDVKTSGTLALDGYAKGKLEGDSYPAFGVSLKVDNASFQYPSLPAAVTAINIDLKAKSPGGALDNTVVDINNFTLNLAGDPFSLKLHLTSPIIDPRIDAALVGKVDLSKVNSYYPLQGDKLSGLLNLNVTAKGRLNAIEKQQYQDFNAAGTAEVSNMEYNSKDLPKALNIKDLKLTFSPKFVSLDNLVAQIGKSDFSGTGRLDNLLNYMFSKALLKGTLSIKSNVIDLNEFMTDSKPATPAKTAPAAAKPATTMAAQVPANIDFVMDATVGKLYYTNMVLTNVAGKLAVKDEEINLTGLKANTLDGAIALDGSYSTFKTDIPKVNMKVGLNKISIEKTATTFQSSSKLLPIITSMKGTYSTNINLKTNLDKDMSPDLNSVVADGRIDVQDMEFSGNKVLNTIADKFKQPQLKSLKAKNFMTVFKIVNGKVYVDPFDVTVDKFKMNIYGSHSLTNVMDYTVLMDAPSELIGAGTNLVGDLLSKSPIPGMSASNLPKQLKFKIGITGKTSDPSVNFGLASGSGGSVKDAVKQTLEDQKKKLLDEANQAKQQAEDRAKAELEKQKQALQQKAQQEADKLKNQAAQKAKDQLKNVFKMP